MSDDCSCECIWTHEMAIRRLLSIIRQSQTYCTDTECVDSPVLSPPSSNNEETSFTMMTMFMVLAVILYFVRPEPIISMYTNKKPSKQSREDRDPPSGSGPPAVI